MNKDQLYKLCKETLVEKCFNQENEIERLNNIINEIEKYSNEEIEKWKKEYEKGDQLDKVNILGYETGMKNILYKIKELKEKE